MVAAKRKANPRQIQQFPKKRQALRVVPKPETIVKPKFKFVSVFVVAVLIILACFIVSRFAEISSNHRALMSLENTLQQRQDLNTLLKLDLASRLDLSRIEVLAATELRMVNPDATQIHRVQFPRNFANITENTSMLPENHVNDEYASTGEAIWNRIFQTDIP